MLSMQKGHCSWSLLAAVGTLLVLLSLVHLFLFPLGPTLDYFGVRQTQTLCVATIESTKGTGSIQHSVELDLDHRFPADLHNAVVYRGAPWKVEIGRWLSGCDSVVKGIHITEKISGKTCGSDCNGQGVCNYELGHCRCFHGFSGDVCSEALNLTCNYPSSPDQPYGRWVVSICPGHCDTTRAMCFCGEGTKYPNRPVAEGCGFETKSRSESVTDWGKPDLDVYTTNTSVPGWCNVDPHEGYARKVKFKEECHCKYDGRAGQFCETPVVSTCINQCSDHGYCRGGFCQCDKGWYGVDCSIPSVLSSIREWPRWLRPAQVDIPGNADLGETIVNLSAVVTKRRPLIYVYDLPPQFNSLLLEGRHFKFHCVNRLYDDRNATFWTEQLYGAQMAIYESILASPYRTLNGEEADFFFVPVLDSCIITRADDSPHLSLMDHGGLRSSFTLEFYKKAYDHIVQQYPYWNQSSGKDHIWLSS